MTYAPSTKTVISVTQGESKIWDFFISRLTSKLGQDLTNYEIYFMVRKRFHETGEVDNDPLIYKRTLNAGGSDTQIVIGNAQTTATGVGRGQLFLEPADTAQLDWHTPYVADMWVITPSSEHRPVLREAIFRVDPRVNVLSLP